MKETFFKIPLSLEVKGGRARLIPPSDLKDLDLRFVVVKEGGNEAVVSVKADKTKLKNLEKAEHCQKLNPKQARELKEKYPPPRLVRKYRPRTHDPGGGKAPNLPGQRETDKKGNPIIDTYQTVRRGFHLIDIQIWEM